MARLKTLSIFTVVLSLVLLLPLPASAQRGGRTGGGARGGGFGSGFSGRAFGGFRGGFTGSRRGFAGSGVRGAFGSGFFGRSFFSTRSRYYSPYYFSFYGYPGFGLYGLFGYDYWPYFWYPPVYGYYPAYSLWGDYGYGTGNGYGQDNSTAQQSTPRSDIPQHYWLIALKNDTILAVTDYWLEGSVFHYMSREGKQYSIDYSQVDLDLTRQLNTERGLEFKPPRAKTSYQPRRYDAYGKPQMPDTRQLAPSPGAVPVSANLR